MTILAFRDAFASPEAQRLFIKGIWTVTVLLVALIVHVMLKRGVSRQLAAGRIKRPSAGLMKRLIGGFTLLFALLALAAVWGVGMENLWVALTGIVGLIAIGFLAVWSMLSNVVAGLLLVLAKPFRIGDRIQVLPDGFEGEVAEIAIFFVTLEMGDGKTVHIPNNMMFQKAILNLGGGREAGSRPEGPAQQAS